MPVKECVGAVIYAPDVFEDIFLMDSPKWPGYLVVPGGRLESGESREDACHRELREELGIEITDLVYVQTKTIPAGTLPFHDRTVEFIFHDYFAKAQSRLFTPNHELGHLSGWYKHGDVLPLPLPEPITALLELYWQHVWQTGGHLNQPFTPMLASQRPG